LVGAERRTAAHAFWHADEVWQAVFSPDERLIATASRDGSARLWNSQTGEPVGLPLRHGTRWVLGAAFSPEGGRLATASRDRTALVWNVDTGAPALPAFRHPDGLNDIQFDPSGRIIVTTGFDSTVRLWMRSRANFFLNLSGIGSKSTRLPSVRTGAPWPPPPTTGP